MCPYFFALFGNQDVTTRDISSRHAVSTKNFVFLRIRICELVSNNNDRPYADPTDLDATTDADIVGKDFILLSVLCVNANWRVVKDKISFAYLGDPARKRVFVRLVFHFGGI